MTQYADKETRDKIDAMLDWPTDGDDPSGLLVPNESQQTAMMNMIRGG